MGVAYRERVLADPHLYKLMTAHPVAGDEPPVPSRRAARATLQPLVEAARDAIDAGLLAGEPTRIAHLLWAAGHRLVGLELHGLALDDAGVVVFEELVEGAESFDRVRGARLQSGGAERAARRVRSVRGVSRASGDRSSVGVMR